MNKNERTSHTTVLPHGLMVKTAHDGSMDSNPVAGAQS